MSKRENFVNKALSWLGTPEGSEGHKTIVADYNKACDPGRQATTSTPWCALFVGGVAEETDNVLKDGIGVPCDLSCGTGSHSLIEKAKKAGIWCEDDAHVPIFGDVIIYDWSDKGVGDDKSGHDHAGIVASVSANNKSFKVVEGNRKNKVGTRSMSVNGRYIRGFICCKFSDEITPPEPIPTPTIETYKVKTNTGVILRLRSKPINGDVVAKMPNGSIVEVDRIENNWAHVLSYTPPKKSKITIEGYASMTYLVKT